MGHQLHDVPRRRVGAIGNPGLLLQQGIALTLDYILLQPAAGKKHKPKGTFLHSHMVAALSWEQAGQRQAIKTRDSSALNSHSLHSQAKMIHGYTNIVDGKACFYASNVLVAGFLGLVVCKHLSPCALLFSRLVREFIRQFDLKLNPFIQTDDNTWYFVNGTRIRAEEVNRNPKILNYTVEPSERGKSASQLYREALNKVCAHGEVMLPSSDVTHPRDTEAISSQLWWTLTCMMG